MTQVDWGERDISLFAVGNTLLRNRWRILRWAVIGGAVAALLVFQRPALYRAQASFLTQGGEGDRSGLANLAGQFGVAIPSSSSTTSLEFYTILLKSPALLREVVRDTFVVQERGGARLTFYQLFDIDPSDASAEQAAVTTLADMIEVGSVKSASLVRVSVATEWPSVSVALVNSVIEAVDAFNQRTRRSAAAAERQFNEARLKDATTDLREAERKMQEFLRTNRQIGESPTLRFERERLEGELQLRQQIFNTLTQSYEEVRLREVRNTPVITPFERAWMPTRPEARGRITAGLAGMFLGAMFGMVLSFASVMMSRAGVRSNPDAQEFFRGVEELKRGLSRPFRKAKPN